MAVMLPCLGDRYLWQDEAETALLARSVLSKGVPTAYDGRNIVSQEGRQEFDPENYIWFWTPWLQHYLAAASFALFGTESTAAARLLFALLGVATVLLTYRLAWAVSGDRLTARLAALLLVLSVPFLLHMRQCRYYAPACFSTVWLLLAYVRLVQGRRWAPLGFVLAAFALFQSNYITLTVVLLATALHFALVQRDRRRWKALVCSYGSTLLLVAPWAYFFMRRTSVAVSFDYVRSIKSLGFALYSINRYVFPLVLLLVPIALWLRRGAGDDDGTARALVRNASLPALTTAVCVILLAIVMPLLFFRYYVVLIPLLSICAGAIVAGVWRWRRAAGAVLLVLLAGSDLMHRVGPWRITWSKLNPAFPILTGDEEPSQVVGQWATFFPLAGYAYELTHNTTGPVEALAAYLNEHGDKADTVITTYSDLSLQFYTGMRVIGGLSCEDPRPYLDAEWIILRAHWHAHSDAYLKDFLTRNVDWDRYQLVELDCRDIPFENRPDPEYHKFRTVTEGLPAVQIHQRIR
jgi:4-amino-4-deoxy-L-arabinose transferase-like glycosyltransferase